MRTLALALLVSCSRDPKPPPAPVVPTECTRVLDDPARTTVRLSPEDTRFELSDEVKAVRAKSGLSNGSQESKRTPSKLSPCEALARAPVVTITNDDLRVGNTRVASLAEASEPGDVIDALLRALPAAEGDVAILMADKSTGVVAVNRVVVTCKRAGYTRLLFAVPGGEPTRAIKLAD